MAVPRSQAIGNVLGATSAPAGRRSAALVLLLALAAAFGPAAPAFGQGAPTVPDAVQTAKALAGRLRDDAITVGLADSTKSREFGGATIGDWVERLERGFSMAVSPLDASVSPDGQRLAVGFVGYHASGEPALPFTILVLIDGHGQVSYLRDGRGKAYFDGVLTSHSEGIYDLFGWIGEGPRILIQAAPFNLGAGGSCEATLWAVETSIGGQEATFQTVNEVYAAKGNSLLYYVAPDGCHGTPHEIHQVRTATGQDTIVREADPEVGIEITGVSEVADGKIELRYREYGGVEQTVTLP